MSIHSTGLGHEEGRLSLGGGGNRLFFSVRETAEVIGCSRPTVYRLLASQMLDARKLGSKTLISGESIRRLAAELPAADIRPHGRWRDSAASRQLTPGPRTRAAK